MKFYIADKSSMKLLVLMDMLTPQLAALESSWSCYSQQMLKKFIY